MARFRSIAAGAAILALAASPGAAEAVIPVGHHSSIGYTLNAVVLDGGEQVVSVRLDTSKLGRIERPASPTAPSPCTPRRRVR